MTSNVLVVGGGYAGVLASLRLARRLGSRARVTLVSEEPSLIERIRLHEHIASGRKVEHPLRELLAGTGVEVIQSRVSSLDLARRRAGLSNGADLRWDRLLLAPGSAIDGGGVPGSRAHALALNFTEAASARAALRALSARGERLAVCGGGLTGVELAAEIAETQPALRVTLVTGGPVAPMLSAPGRDHVRKALVGLGVEVLEGELIEQVEASAVRIAGRAMEFDLCLWAGGFKASPLLAAAALEVNALGQALVDPWLRAIGHEDAYVAGDAACPRERPGHDVVMGCKTAMPMAARAADNLAASLGVGRLRAFDFLDPLLCVSLGRKDAVVQLKDRDGRPSRRIVTGRAGAAIKEMICRGTVFQLRAEKWGLPFWWPETGRVSQDRSPERAPVPGPGQERRALGLIDQRSRREAR